MKQLIDKLIALADALDTAGFEKEADFIDQLTAKAARGDEDFGDLMSLFDEPIGFEDKDDKGPGEEKVVLDEPELYTPLEEEEAPLDAERSVVLRPGLVGTDEEGKDVYAPAAGRLQEIKRRHALMKLKKMLEEAEAEEAAEEVMEDLEAEKSVELPGVEVAEESEETFEDEGEDVDVAVNEAEDELLKEKLEKDEPGTIEKVVSFMKENPELLERLLLLLV